jgi:hypothetical protein
MNECAFRWSSRTFPDPSFNYLSSVDVSTDFPIVVVAKELSAIFRPPWFPGIFW